MFSALLLLLKNKTLYSTIRSGWTTKQVARGWNRTRPPRMVEPMTLIAKPRVVLPYKTKSAMSQGIGNHSIFESALSRRYARNTHGQTLLALCAFSFVCTYVNMRKRTEAPLRLGGVNTWKAGAVQGVVVGTARKQTHSRQTLACMHACMHATCHRGKIENACNAQEESNTPSLLRSANGQDKLPIPTDHPLFYRFQEEKEM